MRSLFDDQGHGVPASQAGYVLVLLSFFLVAMFGFAAISLDVARTLDEQRRIQYVGDAASLAANQKLGSSATMNAVTAEACAVANANGLSNSEISSVQCGVWASGAFTASCTSTCGANSTCTACSNAAVNSVKVTTTKTVNSLFGRVLRRYTIQPNRISVSKATVTPGQACIKPFGVSTLTLGPTAVGQTFTVSNQAPGNWGKLDIGQQMSSGNAFQNAMALPNGICHADANLGNSVSEGTGFGQIPQGFAHVLNQNFFIARTSEFQNGNSNVTILEYLNVTFTGDNNRGGQQWVGTFRLNARNGSPMTNGGTVTNRRLQQ